MLRFDDSIHLLDNQTNKESVAKTCIWVLGHSFTSIQFKNDISKY